jgi:hypothetical protein
MTWIQSCQLLLSERDISYSPSHLITKGHQHVILTMVASSSGIERSNIPIHASVAPTVSEFSSGRCYRGSLAAVQSHLIEYNFKLFLVTSSLCVPALLQPPKRRCVERIRLPSISSVLSRRPMNPPIKHHFRSNHSFISTGRGSGEIFRCLSRFIVT